MACPSALTRPSLLRGSKPLPGCPPAPAASPVRPQSTVRPVASHPRSAALVKYGRRNSVTARAYESAGSPVASQVEKTFTVELPTEEVRRAVVLGQVVKDGRPVIFVSAVGMQSEAEAAGIKPGQVLRAMSHPTATKEFWDITGGERLRYVRDGINTRRTASLKLVFDKDPYVTAADVGEAEGREEEFEEVPSPEMPAMAPVATREPARERDDLYTNNWDGDQYKGSGWNELTVGLGIAVGMPLLGLLFAAATYGKLWGTNGYGYLGF